MQAETSAPETQPESLPTDNAHVEQAPSENSGYRQKRDAQNSYGDEPVTEAPKQEYPQETAPEAAAEQIPSETAAPGAAVEQSGYRKKRENQNSYGDEPQPVEQSEPAPAEAPAPETVPETLPAEVAGQAPSEKSGYRNKRDTQNSYGDEPVTEAPKQEYPQETIAETAAPEVAAEQVPAETHVPDAPVEQSGY